MSTIRVIVTHPGSCHKDEFLACCVMLAGQAVPILRREVAEADLADPAVCVIDVGHRHEPELHNFDHHQFPREDTPTCSLSLVLRHLCLYEEARRFCDWLETTEWFDCRGPIATAAWLGVERDLLNRLNSPVELSLMRRFSQCEELRPGAPLWELMRAIGEDLLDYLRGMSARIQFLKTQHRIWSLESATGPVEVLFVPRTEPLPQEPSFALERFAELEGLVPRLKAVVYPDSRGPGYGLSRFRDHPHFDFLRVAKDPRVHFVHARGFLAKTRSSDPAELQAILQAAQLA